MEYVEEYYNKLNIHKIIKKRLKKGLVFRSNTFQPLAVARIVSKYALLQNNIFTFIKQLKIDLNSKFKIILHPYDKIYLYNLIYRNCRKIGKYAYKKISNKCKYGYSRKVAACILMIMEKKIISFVRKISDFIMSTYFNIYFFLEQSFGAAMTYPYSLIKKDLVYTLQQIHFVIKDIAIKKKKLISLTGFGKVKGTKKLQDYDKIKMYEPLFKPIRELLIKIKSTLNSDVCVYGVSSPIYLNDIEKYIFLSCIRILKKYFKNIKNKNHGYGILKINKDINDLKDYLVRLHYTK